MALDEFKTNDKLLRDIGNTGIKLGVFTIAGLFLFGILFLMIVSSLLEYLKEHGSELVYKSISEYSPSELVSLLIVNVILFLFAIFNEAIELAVSVLFGLNFILLITVILPQYALMKRFSKRNSDESVEEFVLEMDKYYFAMLIILIILAIATQIIFSNDPVGKSTSLGILLAYSFSLLLLGIFASFFTTFRMKGLLAYILVEVDENSKLGKIVSDLYNFELGSTYLAGLFLMFLFFGYAIGIIPENITLDILMIIIAYFQYVILPLFLLSPIFSIILGYKIKKIAIY